VPADITVRRADPAEADQVGALTERVYRPALPPNTWPGTPATARPAVPDPGCPHQVPHLSQSP